MSAIRIAALALVIAALPASAQVWTAANMSNVICTTTATPLAGWTAYTTAANVEPVKPAPPPEPVQELPRIGWGVRP